MRRVHSRSEGRAALAGIADRAPALAAAAGGAGGDRAGEDPGIAGPRVFSSPEPLDTWRLRGSDRRSSQAFRRQEWRRASARHSTSVEGLNIRSFERPVWGTA